MVPFHCVSLYVINCNVVISDRRVCFDYYIANTIKENTIPSSAKLQYHPLYVLFFCSFDKVFTNRKYAFFYFLGELSICYTCISNKISQHNNSKKSSIRGNYVINVSILTEYHKKIYQLVPF